MLAGVVNEGMDYGAFNLLKRNIQDRLAQGRESSLRRDIAANAWLAINSEIAAVSFRRFRR